MNFHTMMDNIFAPVPVAPKLMVQELAITQR